jgi:aryl-alcohol dehydrogenase-like predicted oxidoreductase
MSISRLALGTAQFGLDYGVTNQRGKIQTDEVKEILVRAVEVGITTLDTARGYGNAERTLGELDATQDFRVVTKIDPTTADSVSALLGESTARLNVDAVDTVLLHSFELFENSPSVWPTMVEMRRQGRTKRVGVSLYYPREWHTLRDYCDGHGYELPQAVQFPMSVFDQRFVPLLPEMKSAGTELFARSVFLQGIAFLSEEELNPFFRPIQNSLSLLSAIQEKTGHSRAALLMGFPLLFAEIDDIVIGVDGMATFETNVEDFSSALENVERLRSIDWTSLAIHDESILIPMKWPEARVT